MAERTDMELVRDYAGNASEEAFSRLVERHLNLVYGTALRIVRDHDLAKDVAQAVFIVLARKARGLSDKTILPGWLYRTATFAAGDALKSKRRREQREREACMIDAVPDAPSSWEDVAPVLDQALARLREKDRNAILLRYFQNRNLKEVGAALGISEDTAQKRIARGLEKLRVFFAQRHLAVTAGGVASLLSAQAVQPVPPGTAAAISACAAGGGLSTTTTTILVKGILKMITLVQIKKAALFALGLLLAGTAATVVAQKTITKANASHASTPVEALELLAQALQTHDTNAFLAVTHAQTPAGRALLSRTLALVDAQARFKQALGEKFPPQEANTRMADVNLTAFQFGQNNLEFAEATLEGEAAVVRIPSRSNSNRNRAHRMVFRNGSWKLDVDAKSEFATDKNLASFEALAASIDTSIGELRAGKYPTLEKAVDALVAQAMAAALARQ